VALGLPFLESRHNPKFKQWLKYAEHPEEKDCPWVPVEGWKQALDLAGLPIQLLLVSDPDDRRVARLANSAREAVVITERLMRLISRVEAPQSVVAFLEKPSWDWSAMTPWVILVDRLQDPGNLGTLIRTAAATGLFSVATTAGTVSCFNEKVIRASASSLFAVPFLESVTLQELLERGYRLCAATPDAGETLFDATFDPPCAFAIGREGGGLAPEIEEQANCRLRIPMTKQSESLNAAVAGALIMYEVYRKKGLR
jgi:TrmH family RNA methyltransferase